MGREIEMLYMNSIELMDDRLTSASDQLSTTNRIYQCVVIICNVCRGVSRVRKVDKSVEDGDCPRWVINPTKRTDARRCIDMLPLSAVLHKIDSHCYPNKAVYM